LSFLSLASGFNFVGKYKSARFRAFIEGILKQGRKCDSLPLYASCPEKSIPCVGKEAMACILEGKDGFKMITTLAY
jgi:hypothetical protein